MANYHIADNFRCSSSAFAWGDLVHTKYKSGCLRKILLQSVEVNETIRKHSADVGDINETRHEKRLKDANVSYVRELEFQRPHESVGGLTVSGHVDFVLLDEKAKPISVDELKSITSINVYREVIKNGHYTVENLAQLCTYMGEVNVHEGRLIYTYYTFDKDALEWTATDERIFNVSYDEFGRIIVDGKPSMFTMHDILAHRRLAGIAIRDKEVLARPYRHDAPFVGTCHWCPFKPVCDQYDTGSIESTDAFVELCKQQLVMKKEQVV